jgi:hypothetical protein
MKRRESRKKPNRKKSKTRHPHSTKVPAGKGKYGLGSEIATLFRGIGLKEGEEIPELRGLKLQAPDFVEENES